MMVNRRRGLISAGKRYKIIFKSQDGSTIYSSRYYPDGAEVIVPADRSQIIEDNNGKRTIHTFTGWATSPNQTSGISGSSIPAATEDVIYYAAFSISYKYLVIFKDVSGNTITGDAYTNIYISAGALIPSANIPDPAQQIKPTTYNSSTHIEQFFECVGWNRDANATDPIANPGVPSNTTGTVTYYPIFNVIRERYYLARNGTFFTSYISKSYFSCDTNGNAIIPKAYIITSPNFKVNGGASPVSPVPHHTWRFLPVQTGIKVRNYSRLYITAVQDYSEVRFIGIGTWVAESGTQTSGVYIKGKEGTDVYNKTAITYLGLTSTSKTVKLNYTSTSDTDCVFLAGRNSGAQATISNLWLEKGSSAT